jgi:hypothetical protein
MRKSWNMRKTPIIEKMGLGEIDRKRVQVSLRKMKK